MYTQKVSIIIPLYNVEDYVEKCLDSVLNQTYKNIELIVVNDCSTDNSRAVALEKLKQCNFELKVIDNKVNSGVSMTRHVGMENATGDYITFIDSDDVINKCYIEHLVRAANEGNFDLVASNILEIAQLDSADLAVIDYSVEEMKFNVKSDILRVHGYAWGFLYKKEIIDRNSIQFIGTYMEDVIFNTKYLLNVNTVGLVNSSMYNYYKRSGSLSRPGNRYTVAVKSLMCASIFDDLYLNFENQEKYAELIEDRRYVRNCFFGELALVGFSKYGKMKKEVNPVNKKKILRKMILNSTLSKTEKTKEYIMSFGIFETLIYKIFMR